MSLRIYLFQKDKKEKAQWNATTSPGDSGICVDMHPYFHAQKLQGHLQNVYCQTLWQTGRGFLGWLWHSENNNKLSGCAIWDLSLGFWVHISAVCHEYWLLARLLERLFAVIAVVRERPNKRCHFRCININGCLLEEWLCPCKGVVVSYSFRSVLKVRVKATFCWLGMFKLWCQAQSSWD